MHIVGDYFNFDFFQLNAPRASERCQQEKRKTINGEDILFAMTTLGFDNYVEPLKVYLTKYREVRGVRTISLTIKVVADFIMASYQGNIQFWEVA